MKGHTSRSLIPSRPWTGPRRYATRHASSRMSRACFLRFRLPGPQVCDTLLSGEVPSAELWRIRWETLWTG